MANRLSHSSVTKYQHCGTAWKYHYIDKIRTKTSHAALMFGTALDRALGQMLAPEGLKTPEEIFLEQWTNQEVNGKQKYLPTLETLVYAKTDFDEELLTDVDLVELCGATEIAIGGTEILLNIIKKRNEIGFDKLTIIEKQITNHAFWLCLKNKGFIMLKAYRKKIIPKIKKVLAVQKKIELKNDDGDEVVGFIDLIADFYDHGVVVGDNKTSARNYDEETSVIYSPQLSLYVHAVNDEYQTRKAGFIVLNKAIIKNRTKVCSVCSFVGTKGRTKTCDNETIQTVTNKKGVSEEKLARCNGEWVETIDPDCYIQFLVEEIPLQTEDLVLTNIDEINTAIKTGTYTKNLSKCNDSFGRPCEYINLCYRGSMEGLEDMKEKK